MRERLRQPKVAVSVVFVAATFMTALDITIVNVTLPSIGRDLGVATARLGDLSIAYMVSMAIVIPASGWLGDRFGKERVLLSALAGFTAASVCCGLAQSYSQLVACRVMQGIGGGLLTPVGMALLFRTFPLDERPRASSILTLPTALAPALGPVLGGLLVDQLSWRWVFWINLPIGIATWSFGSSFLRARDEEAPRPFDVPGFLLAAGGLASLMYGISEGPAKGWGNREVLLSSSSGSLLLCGLIWHQLRAKDPLLHLRLFSDRLFRSATATVVLAAASFMGTLYVVALMLQSGLGLSALQSGLTTFPDALGVMVGSQLAGRVLYPRLGPRRLMSGALLAAASLIALMTLVNGPSDLLMMRVLMFLLGLAMAQNFVSVQAAGFARIPVRELAGATAMFSAVRQLGCAAGIAVLTSATVLVGPVRPQGEPDVGAYHLALLAAVGLAFAASALAWTIRDEDAAAPEALTVVTPTLMRVSPDVRPATS